MDGTGLVQNGYSLRKLKVTSIVEEKKGDRYQIWLSRMVCLAFQQFGKRSFVMILVPIAFESGSELVH